MRSSFVLSFAALAFAAVGIVLVSGSVPARQLWATGPVGATTPTPSPTPTGTPTPTPPPGNIQHIVIIVQENRTVDNLLNGMPGADTVSADPVTHALLHPIHMTDPCGISHAHNSFTSEYNNGAMDGFPASTCSVSTPPPSAPAFAYVYPTETDHYRYLGTTYAFANHLLQDNSGPSFPAHQYLFRGQAGGIKTTGGIDFSNPWSISENSSVNGNGTSCKASQGTLTKDLDLRSAYPGNSSSVIPPCIHTNNVIDELIQHGGLSWVYYSDKKTGLWSGPMAEPDLIQYADTDGGTNIINCSPQAMIDMLALQGHGIHALPSLTYIMPDGQWSDHPGDPDTNTDGEDWVANLVNAIGTSSYWSSTVIIVTWDDWGGWYDHYAPGQGSNGGDPTNAIITCSNPLGGYVTPANCGFRVPLIIIGPYVKPGFVVSNPAPVYGALNRFIQRTFGLGEGSMNASDLWTSENFSEAFDFTQAPTPFQTIAPIITPTSRYTNAKCGGGTGGAGVNNDDEDPSHS